MVSAHFEKTALVQRQSKQIADLTVEPAPALLDYCQLQAFYAGYQNRGRVLIAVFQGLPVTAAPAQQVLSVKGTAVLA